MKTTARWEREVIEQAWMKQYFMKLIFDIPQVWLSCTWKLKFEDQAFVSNLFEALCEITEEHLKDEPVYAANNNWWTTPFNKWSLALYVMNLFTKAVERVDSKGRALFNIYIDEEKDKLKAYREKTKETVNELKRHVKENESTIKSLSKVSQPSDPQLNQPQAVIAEPIKIVPVIVNEGEEFWTPPPPKTAPTWAPKKINLSDIIINA